MKTLFKTFFLLSLIIIVLSAVAGFSLLEHFGGDHGVLLINGEDWSNGFGDHDAWDFFGALIGFGVTGLVMFIVMPLVLLFSVGLPLLIVGLVIGGLVLAACSVGALLSSPLLLIVLLFWLVLRKRKA